MTLIDPRWRRPAVLTTVGLLSFASAVAAEARTVHIVRLDARQTIQGAAALTGPVAKGILPSAQGLTTLMQAIEVAHPGPVKIVRLDDRLLIVPGKAAEPLADSRVRVGSFDVANPLSWKIYGVAPSALHALQEQLRVGEAGAQDAWRKTFDDGSRRLLASLDDGGMGDLPDRFVRIEPAEFTMGSPSEETRRMGDETQHRVTLTHPFLIQSTPDTQAQIERIRQNPSLFNASGRYPVDSLTWYEMISYYIEISVQMGFYPAYKMDRDLETNKIKVVVNGPNIYETEGHARDLAGYRPPTEAEWEYAMGGGVGRPFPYGSSFESVPYVLGGSPWEVGTLLPNAFGLYDVGRHVWQWIHDRYGPYPEGPAVDPQGPEVGNFRVARGGGRRDGSGWLRTARRHAYNPDSGSDVLSSRRVRTVP